MEGIRFFYLCVFYLRPLLQEYSYGVRQCCGVVWCGEVRCGVVCCGVVWYGMVWYGMVWYGMVWCVVLWCGVNNRTIYRRMIVLLVKWEEVLSWQFNKVTN
jgi:hypothetical protein